MILKPAPGNPASYGRVAVVMGGSSAEREISLRSGAMVLAALQRKGIDAVAFDPAERTLNDLATGGFASAFLVLHGRYGEDGTIQGALELLRIPYTGSGVLASATAIDKIRTKEIWRSRGLATPAWLVLEAGFNADEVVTELGLPIAVKPASEGSTLGFTKVVAAHELAAAWELAAAYDDVVLAEAFVTGRELTITVLGAGKVARALPVIEIRAPEGNYDYQNKYFGDATRYLCPAPLPPALTTTLQSLSVAAYRAIGCSGWGRVDVMLDDSGRPWLLEVNTAPGMTDHSLVPMSARAAGLEYDDLVELLLADASLKIRGARALPGGSR
jgi:D-alanine-D-alanine ligase